MVSRRDQPGQSTLFGEGPRRSRRAGQGGPPIRPAPIPRSVRILADELPPGLRLGTSSWSFPGWKGLVYAEEATASDLARRGLAAYAAFPIFRTVGIDRTFYAPLPEAQFRDYAAAVPEGFRFLVKAPSAVTRPTLERGGGPNPRFLDARFAAATLIGPASRGLGDELGPILFQFSPMPLRGDRARAEFYARLSDFLADLPRGPLYAVELRNRNLFTQEYADAIAMAPRAGTSAEGGVCHAFNVHPGMPPLEAQASLIPPERGPALVLRWMLREGASYEAAGRRYAPFNRIVDDDPGNRSAVAAMCARALGAGRPAWVIANNNAEGSAPLTLLRLAETIAAGG